MAEAKGNDLRALFPGRDLQLDRIGRVTVYPVGVKHCRRFGAQLNTVLSLLAPLQAEGRAATVAIPYLVANALDLLSECMVFHDVKDVTLEDMPHWVLPTIAEAWIDESFGDEASRRPWVETIER